MSVIAMIGIVMLVGIVKKNAIMMVTLRWSGAASACPPEHAIRRGGAITFSSDHDDTFAAIFGTLPIAIAPVRAPSFASRSASRWSAPLRLAIADAVHHAGGLHLSRSHRSPLNAASEPQAEDSGDGERPHVVAAE